MKKGSALFFFFFRFLLFGKKFSIIRYGIMYGYYICPAFLLYPSLYCCFGEIEKFVFVVQYYDMRPMSKKSDLSRARFVFTSRGQRAGCVCVFVFS